MVHPILPRTLWHETMDGYASLAQAELIDRTEPLIILGEPGMGKTELLRWLGDQPGYAYSTARQLRNAGSGARRLLGNARVLVIDALDELSVQGEGDAVDIVLQRLNEISHPAPRFVLSCRAADWRNATGVAAIREQYGDVDLLVLHLEPLTDDEIHQLLVAELDGDGTRADSVVAHFTHAKLAGLLGNPQTLELAARVARDDQLPHTKAQLFKRAVELLRKEHRDSKADLQPNEATALEAAGAAFAAVILTGSEAIVVETAQPAEGEIPLSEIVALPGAEKLAAVLGSRLFRTAGSANRFSYWHRRIGEYLGSRWLARQADTALKRKRLLALFQSNGVVPASLRGLHAWLAHHNPALAPAVIDADPMGVIEYGDADELDAGQARLLLRSLQKAAAHDPRFRDWQEYSLKAVVQPALADEVRAIVADPDAELGLRMLLLEAVKGSPIAGSLRSELDCVVTGSGAYSLRRAAAHVLIALGSVDWPTILDALRLRKDPDDVQLALEIINETDVAPFGDTVIVALVIAQAQRDDLGHYALRRLADAVSVERLDALLDELVGQIAALGNRHERPGNNELTDFGYRLIARRMHSGPIDAARLWTWLKPFDAEASYHRTAREQVHQIIRENDSLRRAGQRLVLFEEPGSKSVWERAWRLLSRSGGFTPTEDDIVALIEALDPEDRDDEKWRDLLKLIRHSATEGARAREAAKRRVPHRSDMLAWIDKLADPDVPQWQIKQEEKARQRAAKQAMEWQEHRKGFAAEIDAVRRGEFGMIINPAKAYLGLFQDMNHDAAPQDRLAEWLGSEISAAALEGFEAFLQSDAPPIARELAESYAESKSWAASMIIVAALAERVRTGRGFEGVSDDRLTSGFYELLHSRIDHQAKIEVLQPAVEAEMRARGLTRGAVRGWIEPQLEKRRKHVDQLYALMRDDADAAEASELALEWLQRFPDMPYESEAEMVDRLIASHRFDDLRALSEKRLAQSLSEDRKRVWEAVAFLTDFAAQSDRLAKLSAEDPGWMWTIRRRIGSERGRSVVAPLSVDQLAWLLSMFRRAFPNAQHPSGVSTGDTNPWDASEFLASVASRLADITTDAAIAALTALRDAPADGYTTYLKVLAAEQQRKRAEGRYRPPLLADVRAIVEAQPPCTVADLQATLLELVDQVQKRVMADPADPWRGYFTDTGTPHNEERCRDHLLTMLGVRPESIDLLPEGHLADDNRADIIALLGGMRVPVEIKGQWHEDLWQAADTQLDRLYATDYAAERRGIYIVLWFGHNVRDAKKPKAQGRGRKRPKSAEELGAGLVASSHAAQDGRVAIVVLDLERPRLA